MNYTYQPSPAPKTGNYIFIVYVVLALLLQVFLNFINKPQTPIVVVPEATRTVAAGVVPTKPLPPNKVVVKEPEKPKVVSITPTAAPTPPPPPVLNTVQTGRQFYLRLGRSDGGVVLRTGGDVSWRTMDVGRLPYDEETKKLGAIGDYIGIAVFPSEEAGIKALFEYHANDPMSDLFKGHPNALAIAEKATQSPEDVPLKSLSQRQREALVDVLKMHKGYIKGKVSIFESADDYAINGW